MSQQKNNTKIEVNNNQQQNPKRCQSPSPTRSISPSSSPQLPNNASPKGQMQQTKANLDKATKPLFNILRKMMDDLSKNISQASSNDQPISIADLQAQSLNDYQKQYENYCYQLMKFSLEYALTDNEIKIPLGGNSKEGLKNKLQVYMHQIRQHMQMNRKSSLKVLLNKLFSAGSNKIGYDFTESDEEGFFDGQSDKESIITESQIQLIKINNRSHSTNFEEEWDNVAPLKKKLNDYAQIIKDLEFKLKSREETVQVLTTGYVKDIQHMKEMLFRQAKLEDLEFYEVQYFDSSSIIDEKTRLILNDKLKDLKIQFDKKTQDLIKKIIVLSNEVERLKKLSNVGVSSESGIVEAVKKVFVLEDNPYKIWKVFQDIKGNQFFFNIFEQQRPEYGINYKEVNKMLLCKKAYEKEYNDYKMQVDDQICNLVNKTSAELTELQQELQEKESIIEELNQQLSKNQEEEKKKYVEHMQDILIEKETELYEKFEKDKQDIINSYDQEEIEKDQLRGVLLRWACINRMIKSSKITNTESFKEEIRKTLFHNSFQSEAEKKVMKEIETLKKENATLQETISAHDLEKIVIKDEIKQYNDRISVLQSKLQQQSAYLATLKSENYELNAKKSIFDTALKQVYNKLGMKLTDNQFEDLDLDNEKKLSTKEFQKKIKTVDKKQFRAIRESQTAQEKVTEARGVLFQKDDIQTQEVQTCTYGINTKYEDFMKQVEQDLEDQGTPEEIEKLKSQMTDQKQEENEDEADKNENEENNDDNNSQKRSCETADQSVMTELSLAQIQQFQQDIMDLKEENFNLREQIEQQQKEQGAIQKEMENLIGQKDQVEKQLRDTLNSEGFKNNLQSKQQQQNQQTSNGQNQNTQGYSNNSENIQNQQKSGGIQNHNQNNSGSAYTTPRKSLQNSHTKIKKDTDSLGVNKNTKDENSSTQTFKSANPSNKKIPKASNSKIVNQPEGSINTSRENGVLNSQHNSQSTNPRASLSNGEQLKINQSFVNKNGNSNSNNVIKNSNKEINQSRQEISGDITALRRQSHPDFQNNQQAMNGQEYRSDEDDYFEEQPDYTNRDNSDEKPQLKITDKTLKRDLAHPNTRKRNKKRVFERLFQDSKDKQDRMDELKRQLQKLETFHWEEVLSILNLYSKQLHEEFGQSPYDYIRLENNKSPRENQNSNNNSLNQSLLQNSDMKRLNIRQNYPDIQAYTQNNKFPCINPSPIQGGRAEYYFKRQRESSYYNTKNNSQYGPPQQQQQQQNGQTPYQQQQQQQETDLSATFTELNQENYERRKQYLEQVFESFRKHTNRIQIGNKKDPTNDMKIALNESLTSSRKKSLSHARPKTRDVSTFEENLYAQNQNMNNNNYSQINHQGQMTYQLHSNTQADQPLIQSNLYDEPYTSYQNHRSEDPLKKIDQQIKKLKPIHQQQFKSSSNNPSHITPQDSARLQNNILKEKYSIQKVRQEISSANTSMNPKNRQTGQNGGGDHNVFLPESILNLVKKSKQQQNNQGNSQNPQQNFDYMHHY